jgi:hypothetical protein
MTDQRRRDAIAELERELRDREARWKLAILDGSLHPDLVRKRNTNLRNAIDLLKGTAHPATPPTSLF